MLKVEDVGVIMNRGTAKAGRPSLRAVKVLFMAVTGVVPYRRGNPPPPRGWVLPTEGDSVWYLDAVNVAWERWVLSASAAPDERSGSLC